MGLWIQQRLDDKKGVINLHKNVTYGVDDVSFPFLFEPAIWTQF